MATTPRFTHSRSYDIGDPLTSEQTETQPLWELTAGQFGGDFRIAANYGDRVTTEITLTTSEAERLRDLITALLPKEAGR
jgi:hypothetical protein